MTPNASSPMPPAVLAESIIQSLLPYYLLLIFFSTLVLAVYGYLTHDGWMMGDWLINYQSGFIRRGLLGEGIYRMASASPVSVGIVVLAIHSFLFAVYFRYAYLLLRQQRFLLPYCLLIFSPFVFTFQLNSIEGGFRKETLFLALFSYFVYLANTVAVSRLRRCYVVLLLFYPLVILTHEMLALMLPYFLIVYIAKTGWDRRSMLSTSLLLLPSIVSFLASLHYSGNQLQVDEIKQSLIAMDFEIVGGALDWLAFNTAIGLGAVKGFIVDKGYLQLYGLVILLALLAFIPVTNRITSLFRFPVIWFLFFVILLGAFSLFAVAIDWGRFIYMHLIALFLLTLLQLPKNPEIKFRGSTFLTIKNPVFLPIVSIIVILYSQIWYIPHCCNVQPIHSHIHSLNMVSWFQPYVAIIEHYSQTD